MKAFISILLVVSCISLAVSMPSRPDYSQPDGYFQYVNVPGPKEYEFGWRKGNPHHYISRFEQAKDHRFKTRVKWADTKDGYGEHYFEYNHGPKHHDAGGYSDDHKVVAPVYEAPKGYHSAPEEVAVYPETEYKST